jgi:hypothetical protein
MNGETLAVFWCEECGAVMILDKALMLVGVSGVWVAPDYVFVPAKFVTRVDFTDTGAAITDSETDELHSPSRTQGRTWFACMSHNVHSPVVPYPEEFAVTGEWTGALVECEDGEAVTIIFES